MKLLVIKRDKLGDLLLTTPLFARLRAAMPAAQIHLLANDYNAWVVTGNPAIDRVWVYRRVRHAGRVRPAAVLSQVALALALRRERFDVAIVAGGEESPRAIRRACRVGAARTIAFAGPDHRYGRSLTDRVEPQTSLHEVERMLRLLAPLGVDAGDAVPDPRFELPDAARAFAAHWLPGRGLEANGYVVLGLGARRAKKQPSTAQIVRWIEWIHRAHGLATVFVWTPGPSDNPGYPGDDAIAEPVLQANPPGLVAFRGPLVEALGLVWMARTSVFPDSGLMHFAAASPGGVLGFFADPADSAPAARWAPRGPRALWLEAPHRIADLADDTVLERLGQLIAPPVSVVLRG